MEIALCVVIAFLPIVCASFMVTASSETSADPTEVVCCTRPPGTDPDIDARSGMSSSHRYSGSWPFPTMTVLPSDVLTIKTPPLKTDSRVHRIVTNCPGRSVLSVVTFSVLPSWSSPHLLMMMHSSSRKGRAKDPSRA